jgi:ABC-type antimicrobial peptide transport system permease subunit
MIMASETIGTPNFTKSSLEKQQSGSHRVTCRGLAALREYGFALNALYTSTPATIRSSPVRRTAPPPASAIDVPFVSEPESMRRHMSTFTQDVRFAIRMLWHVPAFTLAAVGTLVLGIGATTAAVAIVLTVTVITTLLPARRVSRTDPAHALRAD